MKDLGQFPKTFKRIYMKLKLLFSSWAGRIFLIPTLVFPVLNNIQIALLILLGAYIADFLSGILASYMEIKRGEKPMPPSGLVFESTRARESVVKAIAYIFFILGSVAVEYLFWDKKIAIDQISTKEMGVTEMVIGFCVAIELYSTVVENMKRAGFDIVGKITSGADTIWNLFKKVKGE